MSVEDQLHKIIFDAFKVSKIALLPAERLIVEQLIGKVSEGIEDGTYLGPSEAIEPALENFKKFADSIDNVKAAGEGFLPIPQKFDPNRIREIVGAIESVRDKIRELNPSIEPIDPAALSRNRK